MIRTLLTIYYLFWETISTYISQSFEDFKLICFKISDSFKFFLQNLTLEGLQQL